MPTMVTVLPRKEWIGRVSEMMTLSGDLRAERLRRAA